MFPFSGARFCKGTTWRLSVFIWLLSFLVSAALFLPINYFGGNYYDKSGVCMALPITNEKPTGKYNVLLYKNNATQIGKYHFC